MNAKSPCINWVQRYLHAATQPCTLWWQLSAMSGTATMSNNPTTDDKTTS